MRPRGPGIAPRGRWMSGVGGRRWSPRSARADSSLARRAAGAEEGRFRHACHRVLESSIPAHRAGYRCRADARRVHAAVARVLRHAARVRTAARRGPDRGPRTLRAGGRAADHRPARGRPPAGRGLPRTITSQSGAGLSSIVMYFDPGTDVLRARQMVAERLTQAHALPNVSKSPAMLQPLS